MIRAIQEDDYRQVAGLFANFFKTHNIFQKDPDIVVAYIRKEDLEREAFLVYEQSGMIKGALVLVQKGANHDGSHKVWKFRHFAFETEQIGKELLGEAEKRVKNATHTAKIELTIAENEEGLDFYKKWGYKQEGALLNHFRFGETCFVLGKSFG